MLEASSLSLSQIALDSIQDVLLVLELPEGRILRWNKAFVALTGYGESALSEMTASDLFDKDESLPRQLLDNAEWSAEADLVAADGSRIPFGYTATPVQDPESAQGASVVVIGRDPREQRQYEEALRESEERFRAIADGSFTGIVLHDGTSVIYVNDRFAEITGYPKEHFTGAGEAFELLSPPDQEYFGNVVLDLLEGKPKPEAPVVQVHREDGTARDVIATIRLVSVTGHPAVLVMMFDITEQRRIAERLRESEEKFRFMTEHMHDFAFTVDLQLNATYVSDNVEKVLGWPPERGLSTPVSEQITHESLERIKRRFSDELERDAEEPAGTNRLITDEIEYYHKDGHTVVLETTVSVMHDGDGNPVGLYGLARDITERKEQEERVRLQAAEIEAHARELSRLVAITAHELRHPATVFQGYASMLREAQGMLDSQVAMQAVEGIQRASDRLTDFVEKLVFASDAEREGLEPSPSDVNASDLVKAAVDLIKTKGSSNEFILRLPEKPVRFRADRQQILRALEELLDNAVKFSEASSPVTVTVRQDKTDTVFCVADMGMGVPDEHQAQIFERFYQVDDLLHHSKRGIGLGLHLAKSIVEGHGGWIKASPSPGGGAVISFGIPLKPSISTAPCRQLSVLVVDDDPDIVSLMRLKLNTKGHRCMQAFGGKEALEMIAEQPPDAVVLDIMMPEVTGFQVLEALKSSVETRDIPVVVVSARVEESTRHKALKMGAAAFLVKPCPLNELIEEIETQCR